MNTHKTTSRRNFLKGASAASLSAATLTSLGSVLGGFSTAAAADVSGYKALVCVFLFGGVDSHDVILPYDQVSYDKFKTIRSTLMDDHGAARARENLLPLNPVNASNFGERQFALPPEMSGLHALFEEGNAAIAGNVGPLIEPLNKAQWDNDQGRRPKRLFSHNDQQSTWVASAPEGARFGWGGKFADAAINSGANGNTDFTTITSRGNELFLTGDRALPYQIGLNGAFEIDLLKRYEGTPAYDAMRRHFKAQDFNGSNRLGRDMAAVADNSVELNALFNSSLENLIPLATDFPRQSLGRQLKAIAETIAIRDSLSMQRQVFFAGIGGFDTHSTQAQDLPRRLAQIDQSVTAFYRAMQEMGLGSDVTLFTASDFGRTLAVNGDGTDHGWGSHHFVVGEGVTGKTIYGDIPPAEFGHDQDAGSGRLIPTTSVEQFAEPLGRWFGLTDKELQAALPNFGNFETQADMMSMLPQVL